MLSDMIGVKLILHSHLEGNEIFEVGWFPQDLAAADKDKVKDIHCLEVRVDGLGGKDGVFDEHAHQIRNDIAWQLSDGRLGKAYLVLVEHRQLPKNRVRSYKKLFPYKGQIKQGDHIEFELELEEGWSYFVGMAPITKDNKDECFALAKDFMQAFVLIPGEPTTNVYSREFLEAIIPCLDTRGSISIDYLKLIPKLCSQGLMIFSFSSDLRGNYINIRLFLNGEIKDLAQQVMSQIVGDLS